MSTKAIARWQARRIRLDPDYAQALTQTQGRVHNLKVIYDFVNETYFENTISASVRWGRRHLQQPRQRVSMSFGSYRRHTRLITIHRRLDARDVDPRVLEYVMFHEMLHQKHPCRFVNGRCIWHTKAFLEAEKQYEHYEWGTAYLTANLDRLLFF